MLIFENITLKIYTFQNMEKITYLNMLDCKGALTTKCSLDKEHVKKEYFLLFRFNGQTTLNRDI